MFACGGIPFEETASRFASGLRAHSSNNGFMSGSEHSVAAIAGEIGLDEVEIAARKRFLELGEADLVLLREVHALTGADGAAFSDAFYDFLLEFGELRALLRDDATATRLRHTQGAYFHSLTGGDYGPGYVHDRLRVGIAHQRIGLEPKWYIGAYRKYLAEMMQLLSSRFDGDADRLCAAFNAVLKVVGFDMGLALDTYAHAGQRNVLQYQNYLQQVIDGMPAGLLVVDGERRVRSINSAMSAMLGIPDDALLEHPLLESLIPAVELGERVTAALQTGAPQDAVVVPVDGHADGVRWFEFNLRRTRQAGGDLLLLIGQDVTFRRQARLRLQESEEFFRLTFSQAAIGIALLSRDGRFLRVNRKLSHIVGYSEIELLQRYFGQVTHPDELVEDKELLRRLAAGELRDFRRESRYLCKDGSTVWVALSASAMREAASGQLRLIVAVQDISRRKEAEAAMLRMASHDALTGLPNRLLLQDRLAQAIAHAQRTRKQVSVMFVDLDRFKHINDSLGHDAGDQLIVEIARRLAGALRESDTVARQGGDEFVVVLADIAGPEDAAVVAGKLLDSLFQPVSLCGQELFPSASLGIAMYPQDGRDSETLLKAADSAMYRAKADGGNHHVFFAADMAAETQAHLRIENGLQRGLLREEFLLHYQPQVDVGSGRIVGIEALLRWQPQDGPMVAPADFIPLAEETGLIVPIGEWVLETALRQQARLARLTGGTPPRMSVNMSARQFRQQDVAAKVERLLKDTGCEASWLTLEITESVLMENPVAAAETMARLSGMGVHLAVDDFGTGYSNLANLKRFPIHCLKIDRSFVSDIGGGKDAEGDDAAIVKAVIALAQSMKLDVIAEGVESAAQLDFLGANGCKQMQGYYFSKPVTAGEVEGLLRGQAGEVALA
jgi:diguanylate cyclase (GGDEF)-like protein/PAS domain S-box-containing protein